MNLREAWREIKYQIADKVFKYEMDEAFQMGIREGATFSTRKITFAVELKADRLNMTKTQKLGYQKAIDIVRDTRAVIKDQTGAMFL